VLIPEEIKEFEQVIQDRLHDPHLHLLTRNLTTVDVDAEGHVLYGGAHFGSQSPEDLALRDRTEAAVRDEFKKIPSVLVTNVDVIRQDDTWSVRGEAVGTQAISPTKLDEIEKAVSSRLKRPTKIYLRFRQAVMITDQGNSSVEEFTRERLAEKEKRAQPGQPKGPAETD
jgi:hypothetical protein